MSCFPLPKKLKQLPSSTKKAWTTLTTSLPPKLHRLRHRLHNRRRSSPCPLPHFYTHKQKYQHYQHLQPYTSEPNSPASVYVDRLYGNASTSKEVKVVVNMEASTSGGGGSDGGDEKKCKKVGNNWKEVVSSMPRIKGVDERAEEFIDKFRQQMSLQREQSLLEFQEMLARSS